MMIVALFVISLILINGYNNKTINGNEIWIVMILTAGLTYLCDLEEENKKGVNSMSREKRNMEDMFNDFQSLGLHVSKRLGSFIQNEGYKPTDEHLMEWVDEVNDTINKLNSLKEDVVRYFQD